MIASPTAIAAVRELITTGETAGRVLSTPTEPSQLGLWSLDYATGRTIARSGLVQLGARLPNMDETVAAVFACQPEMRIAWLRIIAGRMRDAGKRRDAGELCQAVDQLADASRRIREEIPHASLQPTGYQALETALFGAAAEQAVVWPKLLRVIGATAELIEGGLGAPATPLPAVDPLDPRRSWCAGRLLQLPATHADARLAFVLTGHCDPLEADEPVAADSPAQVVMRWALYRPWITLLAQVAFVQEAWEAEQISGRLSLELGEDQLANPYEPGRIDVVVTTPDGMKSCAERWDNLPVASSPGSMLLCLLAPRRPHGLMNCWRP